MATNIPGDINQTKQRNAAPVAKKQTSFDITNTPGLKPAGVQTAGKPVATPGYDAQPAISNAQAADDRLQQYTAEVAKPGYSSFSPVRDLQRAADAREQKNAVSIAAPVPQQAQPLQYAEIVPRVSAAGIAVRDNLVNNPGAGDNPARAARMQASYDQPTTNGAGVPIQPIAAGVQSQPTTGAFDVLAQNAGRGDLAGLAEAAGRAITDDKAGGRQMVSRFGVGQAPQSTAGTDAANENAIQRTRNRGSRDALAENPVAESSAKPNNSKAGATSRTDYEMAGPQQPNALSAGDDGATAFSVQGQRGDARTALEIGDAANAERRKTVSSLRDHERTFGVGSGSGNVGQVSSTSIEQAARKAKITGSATDRAAYDSLVRLDAAQHGSRIKGAEDAQPAFKVDAERAAAEAATARAETDQQLNAATSQQQAARARNLATLEAAIVDPNATPDERAEARRNYDVLTTSVKDRYFDVKGGDTADGAERPSAVFDATTGTWVEPGGSQTSNNAAPPGMTLTGQTRDGKKVYTDANGNKHVES